MRKEIYEVWEKHYDTMNEGNWELVYRFSDYKAARSMTEHLSGGWGNLAEIRINYELPPILDATAEEVDEWWISDRYSAFGE